MICSTQSQLDEAIGIGGEIVLAPGQYAPIYCQVPGTTIRCADKWQAEIIAGNDARHGIYMNAPGCTVEGIRVIGSMLSGIKVEEGAAVRDCWIQRAHHNGIVTGRTVEHAPTIQRCLVEYCGTHAQYYHGVYVNGDGAVITSNVIRHNSGRGLHLYPTVSNAVVEYNWIYQQSSGRGVVLKSTGGNSIVGNVVTDAREAIRVMDQHSTDTVADNITFEGGWPYQRGDGPHPDFWTALGRYTNAIS